MEKTILYSIVIYRNRVTPYKSRVPGLPGLYPLALIGPTLQGSINMFIFI